MSEKQLENGTQEKARLQIATYKNRIRIRTWHNLVLRFSLLLSRSGQVGENPGNEVGNDTPETIENPSKITSRLALYCRFSTDSRKKLIYIQLSLPYLCLDFLGYKNFKLFLKHQNIKRLHTVIFSALVSCPNKFNPGFSTSFYSCSCVLVVLIRRG